MAIIGVDLGHGRDTFLRGSKGVYRNGIGYAEYDANSRVGKVLKAKLESAGHTVVMAQPFNSNDVLLTTRTNKYFANSVDLIISLHANYNSNKSASGYAAFYWYNDSAAKKLADLYEDELKKQGFKLWGGSRPSKPNDWSNFHMCRIPSQKGIPSILLENGFMGNDGDFEWIFGSKKNEYAEKCATAAFNTVQRFLGEKPQSNEARHTPSKPDTQPSTSTPKPSGSLGLVDWMNANKMDSSYSNRIKLAKQHGISGYKGTASQNTTLLAKLQANNKPVANKPATSNKGDMKTTSIVTYLNSIKVDSSFANRKKLADVNGVKGYKGTAQQNTLLLSKLRGSKSTSKTPSTTTKPKASLKIDGYWGTETTKSLQRYFTTPVDGKISKPSTVIKALQKLLGVTQDGYLGKVTITAMQKRFGTPQDGIISKPSLMVKELQKRLSKGKL